MGIVMRYRLAALICFFSLFLQTFSLFGEEVFVIDRYQVDMEVMKNNAYGIIEKIDLDFSERRHGIIRKIPLTFDKGIVRISDIDVPGFKFEVEQDKEQAFIRIGSGETFVEGPVSYTISYTYDVGADRLRSMDEFYHNIIGDQWDTTIAEVEFHITMPKSFDGGKVNCTSGPYGSTDNSNVEWNVRGNTISGRSLKSLSNYEALTVALPLPEGYWEGAVMHRPAGWELFQILGYPLYALALIAAFLIWFLFGRDKKLYPTVQFEPPDGLNPSQIGFIVDGEVQSIDVTSLIFYWANKGFLEIEEETESEGKKKKGLILTKTGEINKDAEKYEKKLFDKLFYKREQASTEDLGNPFYKAAGEVMISIAKSMSGKRKQAIYKKSNPLIVFLTGVLAALPLISVVSEGFCYLLGTVGDGISAGAPVAIVPAVAGILLAGHIVNIMSPGRKRSVIIYTLVYFVLAALIGFFIIFFGRLSLIKYLIALLSCVLIAMFITLMSKRTEYGSYILEKVLGFREFIKTVEKERLEALFEADPSYYFNILPYALVMNLSDQWASRFSEIPIDHPSWYKSFGDKRFDSKDFSRDLSDRFSSVTGSIVAPSTSSGSSGSFGGGGSSGGSSSGGSSGGGSGGGGGNSW